MAIEIKINLGCGKDYRNDYINVDDDAELKTDMNFDLDKVPYPFETNSVDEVYMKSVLEHLDNPLEVLREIHRICKPGARVFIQVPHFSSNLSWICVTHKKGYSLLTMTTEYMTDLFRVVSVSPNLAKFPSLFGDKLTRLYEAHLTYLWPVKEIKWWLEVIK